MIATVVARAMLGSRQNLWGNPFPEDLLDCFVEMEGTEDYLCKDNRVDRQMAGFIQNTLLILV